LIYVCTFKIDDDKRKRMEENRRRAQELKMLKLLSVKNESQSIPTVDHSDQNQKENDEPTNLGTTTF